jgi:ABC-type hemin transport system ATPase subunit
VGLALEATAVSYRRCGRTLVQHLSLCVDRGEFLAVVGAAGSGADTLVRLLAGVLAPDRGRILVDGRAAPDHLWPDLAVTVGRRERTHGLGLLCRRAADSGHAVVAAVDDPREVAEHADTLAVLVAGRLVHWATPAQVMRPALRLLDRRTGSLDPSRGAV